MDLSQISEQLKTMQQQIATMQESISNVLLFDDTVLIPQKYYVLDNTGIEDRQYTIEELDVGRILPMNAYPTKDLAKLAELERKINHKIEECARKVNKGKKVDIYDKEQKKYYLVIQDEDNEINQYYVNYAEMKFGTMTLNAPIFLEMDENILMECRRKIEHLADEYFKLRQQLGVF